MALKTVGLLSPGEMGHVVAKVLIDQGMPVVSCLENRSELTQSLAKQVGIHRVESYNQLVIESDIILSILVPAEAKKVAEKVVLATNTTDNQLIYVDCNAIAPNTTKSINQIITEAGNQFIDAGIIGPPPREKTSTRFYASGKEASKFEVLKNYGLDIRIVGPEIGQASGLKMCYAALTKGTAALSTELLVAASKMGLIKSLIEEFKLSQAQSYNALKHSLPSMPTKANRWVGEMEEIAKSFEDVGLTPKIFQGAAELYKFVGKSFLADETFESRDKNRTLTEMIDILKDT